MARRVTRPYAITMWDFSWLERRWPGAGYEDWDRVLDELVDRGYDAVRIDAYPHLVAADPDRRWTLLPQWTENTWGAQSVIEVRILPELLEFIGKSKERGIKVALSTWFRQDEDNTRLRITSPRDHAAVWISTLTAIRDAGLLDNILYVDLCNEFPMRPWAPFMFPADQTTDTATAAELPHTLDRTTPFVTEWMASSIVELRYAFPELEYTYSFSGQTQDWTGQDVTQLDFLEPHLWMASDEISDYYKVIGYDFKSFSPVGIDNVVKRGRRQYLDHQDRYDSQLFAGIANLARWSEAAGKGLVTTECWSIIDYKDWPGLDWGWVNDLNARAVEVASSTGRWIGMSTSNFTGPQFRGVWRDIDWHRRLTDIIKNGPLSLELILPSEPAEKVLVSLDDTSPT